VRANAGTVAALESAISSATWLLPDRFAEGELGLEAVHSAVGLLSVYHEALLAPPSAGGGGWAARLALVLAALQQVRGRRGEGGRDREREREGESWRRGGRPTRFSPPTP
jgi:hypothetical protein